MNQFLSFMSILKSLQTAGISHKPTSSKKKINKKIKQNKRKQTSPDVNHRLKPYIQSAYISPQPASPPNSI